METEERSLVEIMDNQAVTSSRIVSWRFEKRHDRVLRAKDNLKSDLPNFGEYFWESKELDSNSREQRVYLMNFDGFCLIGLGFTGLKALKFKVKFINSFYDVSTTIELFPQFLPSALLK